MSRLGVGGAGFDGSAVVADQPEADLPRRNVDHPAAVAIARVLLPGDGVVLVLLRILEADADGEGLLGVGPGTLLERVAFGLFELERLGEVGRERVFGVFQRLRLGFGLALAEPLLEGRGGGFACLFHLRPDGGKAGVLLFPGGAIGGARHQQDGRRVGDVAVHDFLRGVAEEGAERVEILLRDRVELVVVAGGAAHRHAEPDRAHGVGAILGVDLGVLVFDDAGFVGGDVAALEAGGDALIERGVGKQVAGQLFDGELVEGKVAVEGGDHPIAVGPDFAVVVDVDAVGIAVAGGVQPVAGAMLAIVGRGQVAVHHALVGGGGGVLEKGLDLGGLGRQAGGVERDAADQGAAIFGRRGREALLFELRQNETVDGIAHPGGVCDGGRLGLDGSLEGPVFFPRSAAVDPALEDRDLRRGEALVRIGRRHAEVGVRIADALVEQALGGFAGHDGGAVGAGFERRFPAVEPQAGLRAALSGPWHWKQLSERMGRISRWKSTAGAVCASRRRAIQNASAPPAVPRPAARFR